MRRMFFCVSVGVVLASLFVSACDLIVRDTPPDSIYEAWKKPHVTIDVVKDDMKACGYRDIYLANDLSGSEIEMAETCMMKKGYRLDESSYRPNNCYGNNSPYLCNKYWGGKKPISVPVNQLN